MNEKERNCCLVLSSLIKCGYRKSQVIDVQQHKSTNNDNACAKWMYCVVPENIQAPTTEGISIRTPPPPPPWIFHFCKELMTPTPSEFPQVRQRPPNPSGKVHFHKERLLK